MPTLTVTISIAGKEGVNSSLPFGVRDPQTGLAQPDRPVWVLAQTYPRFAGSDKPGGAETSNPQDLRLRPAEAGGKTEAVWKLSAVRAGKFTLLYSVDAGAHRHRPGGHRRRRHSRRLLRHRDHRGAAGNRSHRQRRNSSRSSRSARAARPARNSRRSQWVAFRGVRRPFTASVLIALLLALVLPACGSANQRDPSPSGNSGERAAAERRRGAEEDRRLRSARLRNRSSGVPEAPLRGRAAGADRGPSRRPPAPAPVPRHPRHGRLRRRGRPALGRLPARLRAQRPLLRLLQRQRRQHPGRRAAPRAAPPKRPRAPAAG